MRGNLSVTREAAFIGYQLQMIHQTFISFTFLRFSTLVWTLTWSEGCGSTSGATWRAQVLALARCSSWHTLSERERDGHKPQMLCLASGLLSPKIISFVFLWISARVHYLT